MKKKMVLLACVLVLAMVFCISCSKSNDSTEGSSSGTNKVEKDNSNKKDTSNDRKETTNEPAKEEQVTLTLWVDFVTAERTEWVNSVVDAYMEQNPNIKIEVTPLPDSADDKLMVAYEAGEGPDVFLSSGPDITSHINGEYVIPLDDLFANHEKSQDILDTAIETVRQYDITGNNQLYYIPNGISVTVLWVRSDWLNETNSTVDTWDNLFKAVENMTDKSQDRYGLSIRGGKGGGKFLQRMMYSYSGITSVFDENGVCTINDPKNVEFVDRYFGLYNVCTAEGDIGYGWTELAAAFDSGKAGIIIHNLGSATNHMEAFNSDQSKFEAIGMPLNELGTSVNLMLQPGGATISSTCKHPEEAFDFVMYLSTGDVVSGYDQQWGVVPIDKTVLANCPWFEGQPWYQASADLLLSNDTVFYNQYSWLPGHDAIWGDIDTMSQYVMTGEMSAQEMCDEWAVMLQELYDDYYKK